MALGHGCPKYMGLFANGAKLLEVVPNSNSWLGNLKFKSPGMVFYKLKDHPICKWQFKSFHQ